MRNGGQPSGLLKINIILSFADVLLIGCVGTVIEKRGIFWREALKKAFLSGGLRKDLKHLREAGER